MRVTNKMLSNNFLRDMRTNLTNMNKIQSQMTSGKQITRPSDDPSKTSKIMQMTSEIDANKHYNSNIKSTSNWLDITDEALGHISDIIGKIDEKLVASGGAYGPDERAAVKDEINQRVEELSQMLNTSFDGKYIFGGTRGTDKPTDSIPDSTNPLNSKLVYSKVGGGELVVPAIPPATDIEYDQIKSKLLVEVSQGVTMEYNVTASEVMNYSKPRIPVNADYPGDFSSLLKNITDHLGSSNAADTAKLSGSDLVSIKEAMTNVLKLRSQVGAKQNRMESAQTRNVDANFNMTEILSSTEDIDITEKTMEYATMQTIYMASLQTSAKVIQPSLLDYLR